MAILVNYDYCFVRNHWTSFVNFYSQNLYRKIQAQQKISASFSWLCIILRRYDGGNIIKKKEKLRNLK